MAESRNASELSFDDIAVDLFESGKKTDKDHELLISDLYMPRDPHLHQTDDSSPGRTDEFPPIDCYLTAGTKTTIR